MSRSDRDDRQLTTTEGRLRRLLDALPDMVWLKDPEGRYLVCNPMFERFFGAAESDIVGKTDFDFIDAELAESFRLNDRAAIEAGGPRRNEEWVRLAADGRRVLLQTTKTPLFDDEGRLLGVLGIGHDITERKRIEDELRASEAKYRLLFDSADELFSVYDRDGSCLLMNHKVAECFGSRPEDCVGKTFAQLHPEKAEEYTARVRRVVDTGRPADYLDRVEFPKAERWLQTRVHPVSGADGRIVAALIVSQDITEHKRANAHLHEQIEELRRWYDATLGRENRILELKREVNALSVQAGEPPRYPSVVSEDDPDG